MLNEKLYAIFCDRNDLGNLLHSHYIYKADLNSQIESKKFIEELLNNYSDQKFIEMGFDKKTKDLIEQLISCKKEDNWKVFIEKFLMGMRDLLEREISNSSRLEIPSDFSMKLKSEMTQLPIYHKNSLIKIDEVQNGVFEINLLNVEWSPEYNPNQMNYYGKWESWRDTQLVFTLNFNKNLFIWDYINVHKKFQGKRLGTNSVLMLEKFARKLGFSRFTVEYPNRQYWIEQLNYQIPNKYRFGAEKNKYTLEGYKEI